MDKKYEEPKSDVGRLVAQYKIALGVLPDDREWDKHFFARYAKYARIILDQLGNLEDAIKFMQFYGTKWQDQGLQWSLKAVADRAVLWKAQQRKKNEELHHQGFRVLNAGAGAAIADSGTGKIVSAGKILDSLGIGGDSQDPD